MDSSESFIEEISEEKIFLEHSFFEIRKRLKIQFLLSEVNWEKTLVLIFNENSRYAFFLEESFKIRVWDFGFQKIRTL